MLEKKRPKMNNLQIFGSVTYVKILGPLKKLDKRSKKLRFIEYTRIYSVAHFNLTTQITHWE